MHAAGVWTDENNRHLACELKYGCVETLGHPSISIGTQSLVFINDVGVTYLREKYLFG